MNLGPVYNGIEIDMLSLENADSILVTRWTLGIPEFILIDGGNKKNYSTVKAFLANSGIRHIHHLVCSHPHDDHAGGLLDLIQDKCFTFGAFWMHLPWNHVEMSRLDWSLKQTTAKRIAKILNESLQMQFDIVQAIVKRGQIPIYEPFAGQRIDCLFICGPTKQFYEALLLDFTDFEKLEILESEISSAERERLLEDIYEVAGIDEEESGLLENPMTSPENNSSPIFWTKYDQSTMIFTADAGSQALERAKDSYQIGNCYWMQIPHHGSRRNITKPLIDYFSPAFAYVSSEGSRKHPRRAVVNGFKERGTKVFSTHYPSRKHLRFHMGNVPQRAGYGPATPLWEAAS